MGDASVGVQARLMSQAMRKLTGICSKSRTSVLFINQIREKIGVMAAARDHAGRPALEVLQLGAD